LQRVRPPLSSETEAFTEYMEDSPRVRRCSAASAKTC
jgi:hypothetical protein